MRVRLGTVRAMGESWPGAVELTVTVSGEGDLPALAYPALVGLPRPGDRVVLSTAALHRHLGTGGYAFVVHVEGRAAPDPTGPGHLVKARYTPQQVLVTCVEEPDSPHHAVLADADGLGGLPVVVVELHSALPAVLAGLRAGAPAVRTVFVMTDGGALPLWFSRTVPALTASGWLAGSVTTGQAFGGDLEAVTVHSGLLAAQLVLGADVAVVGPGPGTAGTASRWGFSGVAAGEAVNAVATLGGRPVVALRMSERDPRARHRGVSHHSLTAFGRVALAPADVAVAGEADEEGVASVVHGLGNRHRLVAVPREPLMSALAACPVPLVTMGRGWQEDPAPFLAAAAAGWHAATLVTSRR
ncbi:MAG: DUF3866 family protein [Mycobacteriales bacterium]